MTTIKQGFGDRNLDIRFAEPYNGHVGMWIQFKGVGSIQSETLSYVSLLELLALRDEINEKIKQLVKL